MSLARSRKTAARSFYVNKVYLIVTVDSVTTAKFRSAIQSFLGIYDGAQANNSFQGIMLDGSHSSQLKAKNSANSTINVAKADSYGNYRQLTQIIALKSTI